MQIRIKFSKYDFYKVPILIFACVIALYQCSERERSNPLDPLNPQTQGKPASPTVVSFQDTVRLTLTPLLLSSITGYNIYRRLVHENIYRFIASLPPDSLEYLDYPAEYDTKRFYRISASTASFESPLSDSVQIRPGPSYVWAIDFDNGELVKLTHDGNHTLFRTGSFPRPLGLDVNTREHTAWIVDPILREVSKFTSNGRQNGQFLVSRGISDIAVDSTDGSFWVLLNDSGVVAHFSSGGEILSRITGFENPVSIALHRTTRRAWVLDRGREEVYEIDDSSVQMRFRDFGSAFDLAINSRANKLWVADSNAVVLIDLESLQIQRTEGFKFLARLAVNEYNGECWAADWLERFGNSTVIKLSSTGQVELELDGFLEPKSLAVNFFNGHCFIAEPANRTFIELDSSGRIVSERLTRGAFSTIVVENLFRDNK